jgi:hypothetical protein
VTPRRWVDDTGDVETLDSADKDLKSFSLMHVTSLPELSKARNSWNELKFGGGTEKGLILVCLSRGSHLLLSFADDSQPLLCFAGGSHPLLRFAGRNRDCLVRNSSVLRKLIPSVGTAVQAFSRPKGAPPSGHRSLLPHPAPEQHLQPAVLRCEKLHHRGSPRRSVLFRQ